MQKTCLICGDLFEAKGNSKTCSKPHRSSCYECGQSFTLAERYSNRDALKAKRLYCSTACNRTARARATKDAALIVKLLTCQDCGNGFTGSPFSKLCESCRNSRKCSNCGRTFTADQGTTCSLACKEELKIKTTEKRLATLKDRGSKTGLSTDEAKAKAANTNLKRYGVANVFQSENVKTRIADTLRERYGITNAMESEDFRAKILATKKERYGDEKYNNSKQAKRTSLERYGAEHYKSVEENNFGDYSTGKKVSDEELEAFLDEWMNLKGRRITLTELQNHYGYASPVTLGKRIRDLGIRDKVGVRDSFLELLVQEILDRNSIKYRKHDRTVLGPQELDFFLPDHNVAIEVNDFLTHNSTSNPWGPPKEKTFHREKTEKCEQVGIRLIHAWENYLRDQTKRSILENAILHACGLTPNRIFARTLKTVELDPIELKTFFNENNIAGYRGGERAFALVDNEGEVFMAYIFGAALFGRGKKKLYDAELIRGASKLGYTVVGGASKLWKYAVAQTDYQTIVYYVDLNLYAGQSLSAIDGFQTIAVRDSFKNYFVKEKTLKNRNPSQHSLIKELTSQNLVWTVWDAGVQVNVWSRS